MSWKCIKLSGAGNSFLLIDLDRLDGLKPSDSKMQEVSIALCDPHFGIGADGFIFLEKISENKYKWHFFNADGSPAEMCGNATRCVGRYLKLKPQDAPIELETLAGTIQVAGIHEGVFESRMTVPADVILEKRQLQTNDQNIEGLFVDTGVPHICIHISQEDYLHLDEGLAEKIQTDKMFYPNETNVTFWTKVSNTEIKATTYERGVREFTLACGTGAVAAGLAYWQSTSSTESLNIQMPGGMLGLRAEHNSVYLSGPAIKIAKIKAKENIG